MDAFIIGLQNLMTFPVIIAILIGSVGGVIIGAVPGIGPAIEIAILLPATVFLDDLISLVLLLGVYGSSMYGGAIPAILINTPGTPVNALTTYDGYAMTRSRFSHVRTASWHPTCASDSVRIYHRRFLSG